MNHAKIKPVIILGSGGHAKVVADILKQQGRDILGLTDPDKQKGDIHFGFKVLGTDEIINRFAIEDIELANGIGSLPGNKIRWNVASRMRSKGYKFITIIHTSAVIAESVSLSEGVQIMAACVLQPDTIIGLDSIINTGVLIDHDCEIGANCHIAPGVTLSGGVHISDDTHIGTGTVVTQYIKIGMKAVVAAGSVVYQNIENDITFIQAK